jgi:hypothetical protein
MRSQQLMVPPEAPATDCLPGHPQTPKADELDRDLQQAAYGETACAAFCHALLRILLLQPTPSPHRAMGSPPTLASPVDCQSCATLERDQAHSQAFSYLSEQKHR